MFAVRPISCHGTIKTCPSSHSIVLPCSTRQNDGLNPLLSSAGLFLMAKCAPKRCVHQCVSATDIEPVRLHRFPKCIRTYWLAIGLDDVLTHCLRLHSILASMIRHSSYFLAVSIAHHCNTLWYHYIIFLTNEAQVYTPP
jgi:hypothetical protein